MNKDKSYKNYKSKKGISEDKEDTTKYGEFVSSYFSWVSLDKQKEKVDELENITKDR